MPPVLGGGPDISVIIVVRNGEKTIEACIRMVLDQDYANLDLIIVDGMSNDGTLNIIRRYEDRIAHWISEPDSGIYDAMNKAVRLATGRWIYFLGADDEMEDCLARVAEILRRDDTVYYGDVFRPSLGRAYDGPFNAFKLAGANICHQAIFYPAAVFRHYAFNLEYRWQADWDLNIRCFHDPGFRFEYMPVTVCTYNDISGSSSANRDPAMERDYMMLLWRHFPAWIAAW